MKKLTTKEITNVVAGTVCTGVEMFRKEEKTEEPVIEARLAVRTGSSSSISMEPS